MLLGTPGCLWACQSQCCGMLGSFIKRKRTAQQNLGVVLVLALLPCELLAAAPGSSMFC